MVNKIIPRGALPAHYLVNNAAKKAKTQRGCAVYFCPKAVALVAIPCLALNAVLAMPAAIGKTVTHLSNLRPNLAAVAIATGLAYTVRNLTALALVTAVLFLSIFCPRLIQKLRQKKLEPTLEKQIALAQASGKQTEANHAEASGKAKAAQATAAEETLTKVREAHEAAMKELHAASNRSRIAVVGDAERREVAARRKLQGEHDVAIASLKQQHAAELKARTEITEVATQRLRDAQSAHETTLREAERKLASAHQDKIDELISAYEARLKAKTSTPGRPSRTRQRQEAELRDLKLANSNLQDRLRQLKFANDVLQATLVPGKTTDALSDILTPTRGRAKTARGAGDRARTITSNSPVGGRHTAVRAAGKRTASLERAAKRAAAGSLVAVVHTPVKKRLSTIIGSPAAPPTGMSADSP